jgi:hypothetical protein
MYVWLGTAFILNYFPFQYPCKGYPSINAPGIRPHNLITRYQRIHQYSSNVFPYALHVSAYCHYWGHSNAENSAMRLSCYNKIVSNIKSGVIFYYTLRKRSNELPLIREEMRVIKNYP